MKFKDMRKFKTASIMLIALIAILLVAKSVFTKDVLPAAIFKKRHTDIIVQSDGTYTQTIDIATQVLTDQAIEKFSTMRFAFFEKSETVELADAELIKPDGKIIVISNSTFVPATRITAQGPEFPDRKELVVVFPNLQRGDITHYKVRVIQKVAKFPNHFSLTQIFPNTVSWGDVKVRLTAPQDYKLKIRTVGMKEENQISQKGSYKTWTWVLEEKESLGSVTTNAKLQSLQISSFLNYTDLAVAYNERAASKSIVSPTIRTLADKVTEGISNKNEQVKRLYEWVRKYIKYRAVYLADSGFIPNEAENVLMNRYGDCKDHAILLEAFLKAKNISSTAVLINTNFSGELPEVVNPDSFNHVITYVPDLDMYLDSTNALAPFGVLPPEDRGRPVLHVNGSNTIEHTPR
jgi:hypothetical protein